VGERAAHCPRVIPSEARNRLPRARPSCIRRGSFDFASNDTRETVGGYCTLAAAVLVERRALSPPTNEHSGGLSARRSTGIAGFRRKSEGSSDPAPAPRAVPPLGMTRAHAGRLLCGGARPFCRRVIPNGARNPLPAARPLCICRGSRAEARDDTFGGVRSAESHRRCHPEPRRRRRTFHHATEKVLRPLRGSG
jgi:hypothetical protein